MKVLNGLIIEGVFYKAINDDDCDCPNNCDIIKMCNNIGGTAPCLMFGEKYHFEITPIRIDSRIEVVHDKNTQKNDPYHIINELRSEIKKYRNKLLIKNGIITIIIAIFGLIVVPIISELIKLYLFK